MKLLKDILYRAGIEEVMGSTNIAIENICIDSREVSKFSLYIAMKGAAFDGHDFIDQAIENGAVAILCENYPLQPRTGISYVKVKDTRFALGNVASNFYDHPSSKIKLIGVTGTNGKTTVATTLYNLFTKLGYSCGLISTVKNKINQEEIAATHTTPDAISLNRLLYQMTEKKCTYCFMEVSSHALDQGRVEGIEFKGAIFTNITHDHLDYHKTFDQYIKAKKKLFDQLKENAFALVNADDRNGSVMIQHCKGRVSTYAMKSSADFKVKIIENQINGLHLMIENTDMYARFIGEFNAYNLLSVYGAAVLLGQDKMNVLTTLSTLTPPDGRFEIINGHDGIVAIVDYAHTPDALENVLNTIRKMVGTGQKIITVVGCGGNRDKAKRPVMGRVAAGISDKVIFTSDNPRNEDPDEIITEMKKDLDIAEAIKVASITDRRDAIHAACRIAEPNDVILIAGKGHEKYQEVNGVKSPFDDVEEVIKALQIIKKDKV
jgi:UDP-N-acetylmuramoyl-L-alanyl-D-glutamate--2,6-diaminopimelate ligase